jgi:hypothetical protein
LTRDGHGDFVPLPQRSTPIISGPATAAMDGASSGAANSQGYITNLSAKEILDRAEKNRGWLHPKVVLLENERECVSLVRAVIPELPHSSQWRERDPVTLENVATIPPGTDCYFRERPQWQRRDRQPCRDLPRRDGWIAASNIACRLLFFSLC